MKHLSFTGTQEGMTPEQSNSVTLAMHDLNNGNTTWHHGDCIGADAQSHGLAFRFGFRIEIHPGDNASKRAYSNQFASSRSMVIHDPLPNLVRNHVMVDAADHLIAAPRTMSEERRSGTWATIRYARKVGCPITICWPDGTVSQEGT